MIKTQILERSPAPQSSSQCGDVIIMVKKDQYNKLKDNNVRNLFEFEVRRIYPELLASSDTFLFALLAARNPTKITLYFSSWKIIEVFGPVAIAPTRRIEIKRVKKLMVPPSCSLVLMPTWLISRLLLVLVFSCKLLSFLVLYELFFLLLFCW